MSKVRVLVPLLLAVAVALTLTALALNPGAAPAAGQTPFVEDASVEFDLLTRDAGLDSSSGWGCFNCLVADPNECENARSGKPCGHAPSCSCQLCGGYFDCYGSW